MLEEIILKGLNNKRITLTISKSKELYFELKELFDNKEIVYPSPLHPDRVYPYDRPYYTLSPFLTCVTSLESN